MPFDCTPRDFGGWHDPSPTWGERLMAWTELAAMVAANAAIVLLIVLLGTLGVVLGIGGNPTGAVDCAGMALLAALVTYPFHLSWAKARALAAGGWF